MRWERAQVISSSNASHAKEERMKRAHIKYTQFPLSSMLLRFPSVSARWIACEVECIIHHSKRSSSRSLIYAYPRQSEESNASSKVDPLEINFSPCVLSLNSIHFTISSLHSSSSILCLPLPRSSPPIWARFLFRVFFFFFCYHSYHHFSATSIFLWLRMAPVPSSPLPSLSPIGIAWVNPYARAK